MKMKSAWLIQTELLQIKIWKMKHGKKHCLLSMYIYKVFNMFPNSLKTQKCATNPLFNQWTFCQNVKNDTSKTPNSANKKQRHHEDTQDQTQRDKTEFHPTRRADAQTHRDAQRHHEGPETERQMCSITNYLGENGRNYLDTNSIPPTQAASLA